MQTSRVLVLCAFSPLLFLDTNLNAWTVNLKIMHHRHQKLGSLFTFILLIRFGISHLLDYALLIPRKFGVIV